MDFFPHQIKIRRIKKSSEESEARSRCGESVFTARFPLVKSNGPKTVVPKATVRAEVRRADGCNHPALVRAVASAVRSTGGFRKKPSKVGLDGKKERASKPCEWTCDARLHFVDGVRLRAHDGDRGVVGEWHARRWELSEDDLALFGESRRVGIEGSEEIRSPGSKLSLSPSISSSVEGLRVALSPVDTVAAPRARHTRALRPVLSAERSAGVKGPWRRRRPAPVRGLSVTTTQRVVTEIPGLLGPRLLGATPGTASSWARRASSRVATPSRWTGAGGGRWKRSRDPSPK